MISAVRCATAQQKGLSTDPRTQAIIVADSMRRLYALASRVAVSDVPVLILGETGTGKEVVARHVHETSARRHRRMVIVNCAALAGTLLESALFGHERGAFTGADAQRKGAFEEADGSTLFLDEVGELSPAAQAMLLRVLESKRFSRVGSAREIQVDVRILSATHRDLEGLVEAGTFRADLFYRLNTMTLTVPPLRARTEEIAPLARMILSHARARWQTRARDFAPDTLRCLARHPWPGNVRELRNVIERATLLCMTDKLEVGDLPETLRSVPASLVAVQSTVAEELAAPRVPAPFRERVRNYEMRLIRTALDRSAGNQSRAAELLHMPMRTLTHKIRAYGLRRTYASEYA